jgi:Concanavalin A-like lectin/glucanases superfamily
VETFTGGHTRVVWLTDAENKDSFAGHNQLRLMGYDSRDGKGERVIWGERANYHRPLITPDGEQIVYSNRQTRRIYVIKWDGSHPRLLKEPGCASEVWRDPKTGKTWVYYQEDPDDYAKPVLRFPMDNPNKVEKVWSSSPVQALPSFQLSRDGKMAASTFPWPTSGIAQLPDVTWRKHRDGCWPSMAPDDSYISWTFDGAHRNLFMTRLGEEKSWKVNISHAPGVNDFEVYHPRWSNDVGYLVMTGPYTVGDKKIKLWDGADGVEIYIGKFGKDFRSIESWLKLTSSREGEFFPDVWIAGGESKSNKFNDAAQISMTPGSKLVHILKSIFGKPYEKVWPGSRAGLLFRWRDNKDNNQFVNGSGELRNVGLTAVGGARYGPNGEMHILGGAFIPDGTFNKEIRDACKKSGEIAIEAIATTSRSPQFGPARIVSLSRGTSKRNFTLGQEDGHLVFRLQTSNTNRNGMDFQLAPLEPNKPSHVLVTYKPGLLTCYLNGQIASQTSLESGSFEDWQGSSYALVFGNEVGGARPWEGYLDGVAIYSGFVGPEEAAKKFELVKAQIAARPKIERKIVKAEMLEKADPPPPESIAPYRRALVINRYKIKEPKGTHAEDETVQVAEWAMLDAKVPSTYADAKPGQILELSLEPYESHPQLESERLASDMSSSDEDFYYSVGSGR